MKIVLIALSLVACILLNTGCNSVAGPFVTNVSSDGQGGLIVEKNSVRLNRVFGTLENGENVNSQQISVGAK